MKKIKQLIRDCKDIFFGWTFDKQMRFFVTCIIVVTSTIILLVSTISAVMSITQQSKKMAVDQVTTLANNFEGELDNYKAMTVALQLDNSVQKYVSFGTKRGSVYSAVASDTYAILQNINNMHENINFIAIINPKTNDYVYKGNRTMATALVASSFVENYKNTMSASKGTLHIDYTNTYFKGKTYSLNLYQPIYSTSNMVNEMGLLVMSIDDTLLNQLSVRDEKGMQSYIYLTTTEGNLVTPSEQYEVGEDLQIGNELRGGQGNFTKDGSMYIYQKIGKWNYYLVNQIPFFELYRNSVETMLILVVAIMVMTMIGLIMARKIVTKSYKPMEKVISKMDKVTSGEIDVRINTDNMPSDFLKMSVGFNDMMDKIGDLMEQVKLEQHQLEQIRFNALQSQIQPHFLYNTLDCIHWQSIAQGNKEVSTMVKALARYYRICLSNGKDIIQLEDELGHIKSYLIIQNMRYDDIIESEILVKRQFYKVMIPKMTLQPLIENSIYHGLKVKEGKRGRVRVSAEERNGDAYIIVEDSGTGMTQKEIDEMNASISEYDDSFGYGVRNVNKRIELMYGEQYGLFYIRNEQGGVTVEIHLPMNEPADYKEIL
ncbi:MAG: sensor histidine kinase [Lachnospiraceae bacterium]|nr:sensor histidine kinase [Lachnospiraceae bacterium]